MTVDGSPVMHMCCERCNQITLHRSEGPEHEQSRWWMYRCTVCNYLDAHRLIELPCDVQVALHDVSERPTLA
jgi:hypothetical protein